MQLEVGEYPYLEAGQKLCGFRKRAGKTQRDVAVAVRVGGQQTVQNWEKGRVRPCEEYLEVLAGVLKLSPQEHGDLLLGFHGVSAYLYSEIWWDSLSEPQKRMEVQRLERELAKYDPEKPERHFKEACEAFHFHGSRLSTKQAKRMISVLWQVLARMSRDRELHASEKIHLAGL